jgi:replicative DNA helicase
MGRLRVLKIYELDQLILLLAQILSMLKSKQLKFNLRMIVIDSLSSLFSGIPTKQNQYYFSLVKELLFYLKSLTKKYFISVIYTNNTKDAMVSRVTELKNLVGEPLSWAVDKQIYSHQNND